MLVHVTRFNTVQGVVHRQVEDAVRSIRQRIQRGIGSAVLLAEMRELWETDFIPATTAVGLVIDDPAIRPAAWEDIVQALGETLADVQVRMINGTAKDALDYVENAGRGLKVIAIGGDKLARGLTLEGLCTSYFLRASKMYDTLMQMGRWFGYRPGYLDLCRLYTTPDLVEWFRHIADASEELREEFDLMQASGGTPFEYGLKVQSHPVLMVTSRVKMRSARTLHLSFSGRVVETIVLHRDPTILKANLQAVRSLIGSLGEADKEPPSRRRSWAGYIWGEVSFERVVTFLQSYRTHPEAHKVVAAVLAQFIQSLTVHGELTTWMVALVGGGDGEIIELVDDVRIKMTLRTERTRMPDRYPLRRLLAPRDEAVDLDDAAWDAALEKTRHDWRATSERRTEKEPDVPSGPAIRAIRGAGTGDVRPRPDRGLLLLYVVDPTRIASDPANEGPPTEVEGIAAFGISFPGSSSGVKVEYKVTNLFWEQEFGAAD